MKKIIAIFLFLGLYGVSFSGCSTKHEMPLSPCAYSDINKGVQLDS